MSVLRHQVNQDVGDSGVATNGCQNVSCFGRPPRYPIGEEVSRYKHQCERSRFQPLTGAPDKRRLAPWV